MSPRVRLVVFVSVVIIVILGIVAGAAVLLTKGEEQPKDPASRAAIRTETDQKDAREAAAVAARYTSDRKATILPPFDDGSADVPVYPAETRIEVDQKTWRRIGESAGVYAELTPQGKRVMIHFKRSGGRWYITQIEPKS